MTVELQIFINLDFLSIFITLFFLNDRSITWTATGLTSNLGNAIGDPFHDHGMKKYPSFELNRFDFSKTTDTLTENGEWRPSPSSSVPLDANENPDNVQELEDGNDNDDDDNKEEEEEEEGKSLLLDVYWEREILLDNGTNFGCLFPDLVSTSWMTTDDDAEEEEEEEEEEERECIFSLKDQIWWRRLVMWVCNEPFGS